MTHTCKTEDPRDTLFTSARAVRGVHALLQNRAAPCFGDAELAAVVELIDEKLWPAAEAIQSYVPREWTPPVV